MSLQEFLAPENFSMVERGIYRSAFPRTKNLSFLERLGLKSVISLVPEEYPDILRTRYASMGIIIIEMGIDGNKWPFKEIDYPRFEEALSTVLDENNWPCLIHCNKGKHRTGCLIASLRLVRGWALSPTFAEYMLFSGARQRLEDQVNPSFLPLSAPPPPLSLSLFQQSTSLIALLVLLGHL